MKKHKLYIPSQVYSHIHDDEVSVICCTNKKNNKDNILKNFLSQTHKKKELIIVLNYNNPDINQWNKKIAPFDNIYIYILDSKHSLGKCLNFAINKSKYHIIAKFDDDDYYAPNYLSHMIKPFYFTSASVLGKSTTYVYFTHKKILAIRNINRDNQYVYRVEGPTLVFKRSVFEKVKFQDQNLGEDIKFCNDCIKNDFKIYSTNKDNFVYIRNNKNTHAWKIDNDYFLKKCRIVCETDNFKKYI